MIILLGKPGTGKSTQGKLLAKSMDYAWVSTGEILRKSLSGQELEQNKKGMLLPDKQMIEVLGPVFKKMSKGKEFILDGFPRTIPQAEWLIDRATTDYKKFLILIYIDIDDDTAKNRLLKRGRDDDNKESIEKRYQVYNKQTAPMISLLKKSGLDMRTVDGNQTAERVQQAIIDILE